MVMALFIMSVIVVLRSDTGTGPLETVVASDDGRATLTIPVGALPEGMTPADVSVTNVTPDFEDGNTVLAYELKPHGINFRLPVVLNVRLDAVEDGLWRPGYNDMALPDILRLSVDGDVTLSEEATRSVNLEDMTVEMEMPLREFSFAVINRSPMRVQFFQFPGTSAHPIGPYFSVESRVYFEPRQETMRTLGKYLGEDEWVEYDHVFEKQRSMYYGGDFGAPSFIAPSFSGNKPEGSYIREDDVSYAYEYLKCNKKGTGRLKYEMFYYYSQQVAMIRVSDGQEAYRNDHIREGTWELTVPVSCYENLSMEYDDEDSPILAVQVLFIGGEAYPYFQFGTWDESCGMCGEAHYHVPGGYAISMTGKKLMDPAFGGCGFGKVSEVPVEIIDVPERILVQWLGEYWHGQ